MRQSWQFAYQTRHHLIAASMGTPHTVFDAALNRTTTLFFKPKAGTDVALAGLFALLSGFVSESLRVRQVGSFARH